MNDQIDIRNLTTGFSRHGKEKKQLHRDLSFTLEQGRLLSILGLNGTGKSTLLRTLLGYQPAWAGEVFYQGKKLSALSVKEMARIVAVVLTEAIEDLYLTAYEVVMTGRYPHGSFTGRLTDHDKALIGEAFDRVGVTGLADRPFHRLSDGEKQKVMLARAIAQDTPFIFLDEPVAFIDAPSRIVVMQLLKQLTADPGKGVLMATHDLDAALHFSDHLLLLGEEGRWDQGKPEKMVTGGYINAYFDRDNVTYDTGDRRFVWSGNND